MKQKSKFKQTEIGMIPEDWEVEKLGDIGELKNGVNFNRNDFGEGFPIINVTNLFRGKYATINNLDEIKKGTLKNPDNYFVKRGDLLFARSSLKHSGTGQAAMVYNLPKNETVFSGFIIRFRLNDDSKINYEFLNYLVRSELYRAYIRKSMDGTTITNINQVFLSNLPVILPPLPEQSAIAKILSSLDSKIELNQQMNKTLEAIGQAIFKRWFVDFEFPDEQDKPYKSSGGEMVDSEIGEIPKGWKVSKIGKEFETILGGTPSTTNKSYWENGTIAWINSGEINKFRITEPTAYITEEAVDNSATKLMSKGTTVLAITGATLGQVSRIEIDTCANQSVIGIIENKDIPSEYIYLWIKHKIIGLISHQTGGAQQHINKNNVNELEILLPDDSLMLKFKEMMRSIFKNISINCFESQNLSQIRDSLLPRLMSGKIRVPVEVRT